MRIVIDTNVVIKLASNPIIAPVTLLRAYYPGRLE